MQEEARETTYYLPPPDSERGGGDDLPPESPAAYSWEGELNLERLRQMSLSNDGGNSPESESLNHNLQRVDWQYSNGHSARDQDERPWPPSVASKVFYNLLYN